LLLDKSQQPSRGLLEKMNNRALTLFIVFPRSISSHFLLGAIPGR
jgi:hypothetical protein